MVAVCSMAKSDHAMLHLHVTEILYRFVWGREVSVSLKGGYMKYTFTFICFLIAPAWVFSQGDTYLVQGQLAIQKIPEWAYLVPDSELPQQVDSVEIKDGYFEFRGELIRPLKARVFTGKNFRQAVKGHCLYLYLEPDTVFISSPDTLRHAQVTGGPENQCYSELRTLLRQADSRLRSFAGAYLGIPAFYEDSLAGTDKGVYPGVLFRQSESNNSHLSVVMIIFHAFQENDHYATGQRYTASFKTNIFHRLFFVSVSLATAAFIFGAGTGTVRLRLSFLDRIIGSDWCSVL